MYFRSPFFGLFAHDLEHIMHRNLLRHEMIMRQELERAMNTFAALEQQSIEPARPSRSIKPKEAEAKIEAPKEKESEGKIDAVKAKESEELTFFGDKFLFQLNQRFFLSLVANDTKFFFTKCSMSQKGGRKKFLKKMAKNFLI